jgi:membrane associated rhomboid family serine protease
MDDPTPERPTAGAGARGAEPGAIPVPDGPLSRELAAALLANADDLLANGEFREAAARYQRVVGFPDPAVTAAALIGLGESLFRLDREDAALAAWQSVLDLPETPATYLAWRNIAAARVRDRDLEGAIKAYREAERRAPEEARPEIASRLGWLAKETGDLGAARRYFSRARGELGFPLSYLIIGLTAVVSLTAESSRDGQLLFELFQLDKAAVAQGEWWRLFTVTLLHGGLLHLLFNMYALYLSGPIVEQLYGRRLFLLFYLLLAAAGSIGSFVFGGDRPAVGASGAIFGLFGLLLAVSRTHNPVLDRRGRMFLGQIGSLVLVNLLIGLVIPNVDNAAHVGGLLGGLWIGYLIPPGRVRTVRAMWQQPGGDSQAGALVLRTLGVLALVVVLVVGLLVGTAARRPSAATHQIAVSRLPG